MSYKENPNMGNSASIAVKSEPRDTVLTPLQRLDSLNQGNTVNTPEKLKLEPSDAARVFLERGLPVPSYIQNGMGTGLNLQTEANLQNDSPGSIAKQEDVIMQDANIPSVPEPLKPTYFTMYDSANQIAYTPEDALKEGLGMVKAITTSLKQLQLGSKLRQEVWAREIENLRGQAAPTTLIAVCGATGAGKSSILNAILDDNIVPTSGMRACTAVVTEIGYHKKSTIDADVSFLSEAEWKAELAILLTDLVDEDGNLKRSTDLKSDAGVAWQKVHAVYPSLLQEQIVAMTANQIIDRDPNIAKILGTTKKIVAQDSKIFAKEISKYIDSKDQKRGDKKDKKKQKEKSLMDKVRQAAGTSKKQDASKADQDAPALWPLIRQVNVRCSSAALSSGAVLVDLPGVADANAARNNIAKDYMKKCDCIWILAPITRAVDDKTARDLLGDAFKMQLMNGNYDDHTITFIASKCDDVSCSEVICALHLEDDPELEEIEARLDQYTEEMSEWNKTKSTADKEAKAIDKELDTIRKFSCEYEDHLAALQDGKPFTRRLTANGKVTKKASTKKRKNARDGKKGSSKRRRSEPVDDEDESMASDSASDDDSSHSDSDSFSDKDSDEESISSNELDEPASGSEAGSDDAEESEITTEYLEGKIKETREAIKAARARLAEARKQRKEATDHLSSLKKNVAKGQKEKNRFCSLKRSEFSRDVLKEDFRVGLKDLDDAAAEERDPDNFNPAQNIRDYDAIDLPVFTCSSRDYVRLKGQVKGDGESTCFSNAKDTGIPDLQQWCHQLTVSSRERAARTFLAHLMTFATSIQSYVKGIGDITAVDRDALREKWESGNIDSHDDDDSDEDSNGGGRYGAWATSSDPVGNINAILGGFGVLGTSLYSMNKKALKVNEYGQATGIIPRLALEFSQLTDQCVKDLQECFKDGLEDKCKVGATNAASSALSTSDEFAASMHWSTYRATLRRHGTWRRDLNVELINPFTRNIAHSWGKVFELDLFAPFEAGATKAINKLLEDVEDSAALGLKDSTKMQGGRCLDEARVALKKTMDVVKETMNNQQKEVSRCMAPHIQAQLVDGYDRAMEARGTGSVARQKMIFRTYIEQCKDDIFEDGADVVMERLTKAAEAVGEALDDALEELAKKIEVNLSVLWEDTRVDPAQARARKNVTDIVAGILNHIRLWMEAQEMKRATSPQTEN